jgi:hypothetical protein
MFTHNRASIVYLCLVGAALTGCLQQKSLLNGIPGEAVTQNPGGGGGSGPCGATAGSFAFCAGTTQTVHLGANNVATISIGAASDFEGDVSLSLDRTSLNSIDTKGTVTTQLGQTTLHLAPGSTNSVSIRVATTTMSPTISSSYHVIATRMGSAGSASGTVPLEVQAIWDVYLHGGTAPETWDANPTSTPAKFVTHTEGLTINFWNMDPAAMHIIHGNGIVPHQNTAMPLAAAPGNGQPGGVYTIKLTGTTAGTGSYYCHTHETTTDARTVMTNQAP